MSKITSIAAACLLAVGTLGASSAFAASYTVGGSPNGTSIVTGPTTASVAGNPLPCSQASFTVMVTNGVAQITAATFGPSAACMGITANALPWSIAAPTNAGSPPNNVTISGVSVSIPALGATCPTTGTGSVGGGLTAAGSFTFSGTLGFCSVMSTAAMASSPALQAVFP